MPPRDQNASGARKQAAGWKAPALFLGMLLGGGVLGYLLGFVLGRGPSASDSGLKTVLDALSAWDLLALPLLVLAVIAVHEAGHLLMGLRQGMRFLLYVVG
ncbi:MAG: hypothetical protein EOP91_10470, partial [Lysobacteraceae bacterium]